MALQNLPFLDYSVDVQLKYAGAAQIIRQGAVYFSRGGEYQVVRDFPVVSAFVGKYLMSAEDDMGATVDFTIRNCYKYWKHFTGHPVEPHAVLAYENLWEEHIGSSELPPFPLAWHGTNKLVSHGPDEITQFHTYLHNFSHQAVNQPSTPEANYPPVLSCRYPPPAEPIELPVPDLPTHSPCTFRYYGEVRDSKIILANVGHLSKDEIPDEAILFMAKVMQRNDLTLIIEGGCDIYVDEILDALSCGIAIDENEKHAKFKHYRTALPLSNAMEMDTVELPDEQEAECCNCRWSEGTMYEGRIQDFVRFARHIHDGDEGIMSCYHQGQEMQVKSTDGVLYMLDLDINNSCLLNSYYQVRMKLPVFSPGAKFCAADCVRHNQ
jgi:hypothetical protein